MGELRPPWEPGNTAAVTHGADSPRAVQPLADELAEAMAIEAPELLGSPVFVAELRAWAWEEARCRLLQAWVNEHGLLDEESQGALGQLERAQARASRLRGNLGLNPLAMARLLAARSTASGDDRARAALEATATAGREAVARRQAELEAGEGDR